MIDAMSVVRKKGDAYKYGTDGSDSCPYGIGRAYRECLRGLCQQYGTQNVEFIFIMPLWLLALRRCSGEQGSESAASPVVGDCSNLLRRCKGTKFLSEYSR